MVNQVVHQIGKLEMDSLTGTHFAFSPLYSSHSLPHPTSLFLLLIANISLYRYY